MSLSLSHWYIWSGVVVDLIDFRSLHFFSLFIRNNRKVQQSTHTLAPAYRYFAEPNYYKGTEYKV